MHRRPIPCLALGAAWLLASAVPLTAHADHDGDERHVEVAHGGHDDVVLHELDARPDARTLILAVPAAIETLPVLDGAQAIVPVAAAAPVYAGPDPPPRRSRAPPATS